METKIEPIINGSVNPRLTQDMFNDLDFTTKRSVIWNIIVSIRYAHSFPEVDHRCFEAPDEKFVYDSITEENANELFATVKQKFIEHHNKMKRKTTELHYKMGFDIYNMQEKLGFGGFIELTIHRLRGYISGCGSWNEFKSSKVSGAILEMHNLAPRKDYGPNNCNSGNIMHTFKTVYGCEYIIMEFDFVSKEDTEIIKQFYKERWETKGKSIDADSIRFEETDHGNGYYGIELFWWWD